MVEVARSHWPALLKGAIAPSYLGHVDPQWAIREYGALLLQRVSKCPRVHQTALPPTFRQLHHLPLSVTTVFRHWIICDATPAQTPAQLRPQCWTLRQTRAASEETSEINPMGAFRTRDCYTNLRSGRRYAH